MKYRAERLDGKGKVEGYYVKNTLMWKSGIFGVPDMKGLEEHVIFNGTVEYNQVKPETLEIHLFGEWRLVSELEKPCEWTMLTENNEAVISESACGKQFIFEKRSYFKFCPYCGRPIK